MVSPSYISAILAPPHHPFPNKAMSTGPRGHTVDLSFGGHHSAICKSQDKISILIRVCTVKLGATVKTSVKLDSPWKYLNSPLIIFSVGS